MDLSKLSPEQQLLLLQVALKSADLGHVAENLDVHIRCDGLHCPSNFTTTPFTRVVSMQA